MVQLPSTIEVEETVDGFRYVLPARDAAAGARGILFFGAIFGGFALVWIVMAVSITQLADEAGMFFQICFPMFGLPFLLVGAALFLNGAKLAWARTLIEVDAETMRITDGWSFMRKTRRRAIAAIRQLIVKSNQGTQAGSCAIVANCENVPNLRFASGYSQTILVAVAESLLQRTDIKDAGGRPLGSSTPGVIVSTAGIPHVPDPRPSNVVLSSTNGVVGGLILLIIALVWNGVIATIVTVWYMDQGFSLWMLLVVTVFGGVGLLILFGAIHQLLASSRMKSPVVSLSSSPVLIGETVTASFTQVPKRGVQINRVTVRVVCRESATYTHGTNTTTVTHDVSEQEFVLLENTHASPLQPLAGEFPIVIPDDAMHSLDASHNSITWMIETHTDISGWPDLKQSMEFEVAAQRVQLPASGLASHS